MDSVKVLSQVKAEAYWRQCKSPLYVVSITAVGDKPAKIPAIGGQIRGLLRVEFDDVSAGAPNCISKENAKAICDFVNQHWSKSGELLIHCGMGVSRSAGAAAAVLKAETGDDTLIMDSEAYRPNMTVYSLVLNTFVEGMTDKEMNQTIYKNRGQR